MASVLDSTRSVRFAFLFFTAAITCTTLFVPAVQADEQQANGGDGAIEARQSLAERWAVAGRALGRLAVRRQMHREGTADVIVMLKRDGMALHDLDGVDSRAMGRLQRRAARRFAAKGMRVGRQLREVPMVAMTVDRTEFAALQVMADVEAVYPDRRFYLSLDRSGEVIGAPFANTAGATGEGATVAILDTGVEARHPAFGNRVVEEACFSRNSSRSVSMCPGSRNTVTGPGAAAPCTGTAGCDHGTHVAGIAAGSDSRYPGVAPEASIIAVKVFAEARDRSECGGSRCLFANESDIMAGLEYVYSLRSRYNIAAVNLSLGGEDFSSVAQCEARNPAARAMFARLRDAGIATVVAAGNNGATGALGTPACFSNVISVGATNNADVLAGFSNISSELSLLAPGVGIRAPIPPNGFGFKSGTSMATPQVAGAITALRGFTGEAGTRTSVTDTLALLRGTGRSVRSRKGAFTTPRLALDAAVRKLAPPVATPPPPAPAREVIVDDQDGATRRTGDWRNSTGASPFRGRSLYSTGAATFRWTPTLTAAGSYDVYARWTHHPNRATSVPYTVSHRDGRSTVRVNQRDASLAARWRLLGRFDFNSGGTATGSGSAAFVEVSGAGGQASADAVRFLPAGGPAPTPPPATPDPTPASERIVDNTDGRTSRTGTWRVSSGASPYGSNSLYSDSAGTFSWQTGPLDADRYTVYARWTYHPNRASAVPYTVRYASGSREVVVNQANRSIAASWKSLGTYRFDAGGGEVSVSSSRGQASADAIRLVREP